MTEAITSPQNQFVKMAAALKQKKYREELGLFAVEGVRLAEELVAAEWAAEVCLYTGEAAANPRAANVLARLADNHCRLVEVAAAVYAKATDTQEPQGLMVLARKKNIPFTELLSPPGPALIAVLDGINDPGNVGTIIRAADAAGCSGVVLLSGCADLFAGKTVRATMGSLFHLPVTEGLTRPALIAALSAAGIPLLATALEAAQPYFASDLRGPCAIAFGNEAHGVSAEILAPAAGCITIPIYGKAESLNVAAAAAVILYEAARQRSTTL